MFCTISHPNPPKNRKEHERTSFFTRCTFGKIIQELDQLPPKFHLQPYFLVVLQWSGRSFSYRVHMGSILNPANLANPRSGLFPLFPGKIIISNLNSMIIWTVQSLSCLLNSPLLVKKTCCCLNDLFSRHVCNFRDCNSIS